MLKTERWGLIWQSKNRLDGENAHVIITQFHGYPFFFTRKEAREFRDKHYGDFRHRADLKAEPHGWRLPRVARVKITYAEAKP